MCLHPQQSNPNPKMSFALERKARQIKEAYALLLNVDRFTVHQLAEMLCYDAPDMVYKIANPETSVLPPLDRHELARERLAEVGSHRLTLVSEPRARVIDPPSGIYINRRTDDDWQRMTAAYIDLVRAATRQEKRACLARMRQAMETIEAEVEAEEGALMKAVSGDGR